MRLVEEDLAAVRNRHQICVLEEDREGEQSRSCAALEEVPEVVRSHYFAVPVVAGQGVARSHCPSVPEEAQILYPADDPVAALKVLSSRCYHGPAAEAQEEERSHSIGDLEVALAAEAALVEERSHYPGDQVVVPVEGEHNHYHVFPAVVVAAPEEVQSPDAGVPEAGQVVEVRSHYRCDDPAGGQAVVQSHDVPDLDPEADLGEAHTPELRVPAAVHGGAAHNLLLPAGGGAVAGDPEVDLEVEVHSSAADAVLSAQWNEVLSRHRRRTLASSRLRCDEGRECHPPFHLCRRNT
jgi:hypothetical protein